MLKSWCKILPFFVVVWIARKYGETFSICVGSASREDMRVVVSPYKGIYFYTSAEMERLRARQDYCK